MYKSKNKNLKIALQKYNINIFQTWPTIKKN